MAWGGFKSLAEPRFGAAGCYAGGGQGLPVSGSALSGFLFVRRWLTPGLIVAECRLGWTDLENRAFLAPHGDGNRA